MTSKPKDNGLADSFKAAKNAEAQALLDSQDKSTPVKPPDNTRKGSILAKPSPPEVKQAIPKLVTKNDNQDFVNGDIDTAMRQKAIDELNLSDEHKQHLKDQLKEIQNLSDDADKQFESHRQQILKDSEGPFGSSIGATIGRVALGIVTLGVSEKYIQASIQQNIQRDTNLYAQQLAKQETKNKYVGQKAGVQNEIDTAAAGAVALTYKQHLLEIQHKHPELAKQVAIALAPVDKIYSEAKLADIQHNVANKNQDQIIGVDQENAKTNRLNAGTNAFNAQTERAKLGLEAAKLQQPNREDLIQTSGVTVTDPKTGKSHNLPGQLLKATLGSKEEVADARNMQSAKADFDNAANQLKPLLNLTSQNGDEKGEVDAGLAALRASLAPLLTDKNGNEKGAAKSINETLDELESTRFKIFSSQRVALLNKLQNLVAHTARQSLIRVGAQ